MKEKKNALIAEWKEDKLWGSLSLCWLVTVFSSFFNSYLFPILVPGLGTMFPFRFILPVTALLYLIWAVRERENPWKDATALEKWVYVLIVIMLAYGTVSLFWAIDFGHSFRMLFNLYFDLCFFFLMLRLCRDKRLFRSTLWVSAAVALFFAVMGVYEAFNGGIFSDRYDGRISVYFFNTPVQYPVVTSGNTNDYAAMLLFIAAAVFLLWARDSEPLTRRKLWLVILPFPLILFSVEASTARLVKVGFILLFVGVLVWFLFRGRKLLRVLAMMLVLVLCVESAFQYHFYISPALQYVAEMVEYRKWLAENQPETTETPNASPAETSDVPPAETSDVPPAETSDVPPAETLGVPPSETPAPPPTEPPTPPPTEPPTPPPTEPPTPPTPPTLGDPRDQTLKDEFFTTNKETGEQELHTTSSAGIRVRLLIHAFNCFRESYGLGVGLGNTETLAAQRIVVPTWKNNTQDSIHCFIARIVADYGLFVVIPLCAIAFLLIKRTWEQFAAAVREKDRSAVGLSLLFLFVLLTYPFVSTASSDAQDSIDMWIYLASIVLFSVQLKANRTEKI